MKYNVLMMILVLVGLSRCGSDSPTPAAPSLVASMDATLVGGAFEGVVGSAVSGTVSLHFEGVAPAGVESLEIFRLYDGTDATSRHLVDNTVITDKEFIYDYTYQLNGGDVCACQVTLQAVLTDKKGRSESVSIGGINASWPLITVENVTLLNDNNGAIGDALDYFMSVKQTTYSLKDGATYVVSGVSRNDLSTSNAYDGVHILFNYASIGGHHLTSPNNALTNTYYEDPGLVDGFTTTNATIIKIVDRTTLGTKETLILDNFDAYSVMELRQLFDGLSLGPNPEFVSLGDVTNKLVLFETADGRVGMMDNLLLSDAFTLKSLSFRLRIMNGQG